VTALAVAGAVLTVVALGVLLWAVRERPDLQLVPKMAASTGFILVALGGGALDTSYGRMVVAALALSWLGDLFLVGRDRRAFLAGLVAFLLGHVAYVAAFAVRGIAWVAAAAAAVVLGAVAIAVGRWLWPHLPDEMRVPVLAYVAVITTMAALSFATAGAEGDLRIPVGATAFFLSDVFVARDQFVARAVANRLWGLPLYYAGQLLLAWSAGG
jgi:uncharacterized membrane protein YhhN